MICLHKCPRLRETSNEFRREIRDFKKEIHAVKAGGHTPREFSTLSYFSPERVYSQSRKLNKLIFSILSQESSRDYAQAKSFVSRQRNGITIYATNQRCWRALFDDILLYAISITVSHSHRLSQAARRY